jgi:hypothetical protein
VDPKKRQTPVEYHVVPDKNKNNSSTQAGDK